MKDGLWVQVVTNPWASKQNGFPPHPSFGHLIGDPKAHTRREGKVVQASSSKGIKFTFPPKRRKK